MNKIISILMVIILNGCASQSLTSDPAVHSKAKIANDSFVNAERDWRTIASKIADQTHKTLKELNQLSQPVSVYAEKSTYFSDSLNELIVTELVNKGVIVKSGLDKRLSLIHDVDYVSLDPSGEYRKSAKYVDAGGNIKVLINSSLIKDGIYIMRITNEYFINSSDVNVHLEKKKFNSKLLNSANRCGDKDCGK